ncbi:MAG: tetratricopeptide repeat protein [Oscillospiraceae bacterium]|nr:tetratricopeptide repeat protein [Oscillospiraceae bacterium]
MDWTLLGIAPTDDKKAIKAAYRAQLSRVNPEDKPEEFKALRSAYEEALALADRPAVEETRDESPLGRWREKLAALYADFPARIRPEGWQALLEDEVCVALDSRPLAEEALLRFFMEDYFIPQRIWQLLDGCFHWSERREELYEGYPRDFIDYAVLNGIRYPENLPYELFVPGTNAAACDDYRRIYYRAGRVPNEELAPLIEQLLALPESHPYGEHLRCRLLEQDEAREIYRRLAADYPDDPKFLLEWAAQCLNDGDYSQAEQYCRRVVELSPQAAYPREMLAVCLAKQGQYEDAKKIIFRLSDEAGGDQKRIHELKGLLREWNESYISILEERLRETPGDAGSQVSLAWSYLQNDRVEDSLALCKRIDEKKADPYDYHNLYAKALYASSHWEEALEHFVVLESLLRAMEPDGTEKTADRLATLPEKLQLQGSCLMGLERRAEALEKYEAALAMAPDNAEVVTNMGRLLCGMKELERGAALFERLTGLLPGAYHGYYLLAQTYFDLGRDRDAFDAVNRALNIEGGDLGVYVLKMRILLRNGVWAEVRETLTFLREHGVTDPLEVLWCEGQLLERGEEKKDEALALYKAIAHRLEQGESLEEAARLYYRILVLTGEGLDARKEADRETMLALAEKALSYDKNDLPALDYKAWLLRRAGRTKEALEIYLRLEKEPRRGTDVEEALAEIYYEDLDCHAAEALHYYSILNENNEQPVYLFYMGTCCRYLGDYARAEQLFLRVQELSPDGIDGCNGMSWLYDVMGRHADSLAQVERVIAIAREREGNQSKYFYHKLRILRRLGRWEEALATLDELTALYGNEDVYRERFDVCCQFARWERAEEILREWKRSGKQKKELTAARIDLALFRGKAGEARRLMLFGSLTEKDHERISLLLAELEGRETAQMNIWKKRMSGQGEKSWELMNMAQVQWWSGRYEAARSYAEQALEKLEKAIPRNKGYEALYRSRRCVVLAILGRMEEAKAELALVRTLPLCENCDYCACKDADIFEANLEEIGGNWQRALELYRAGAARWSDDLDFAAGIERMKRKGN